MMNPAQSSLTRIAADLTERGPVVAVSFVALLLGVGLYVAASVLFFLDVAKSGAAQRASLGSPKEGAGAERPRPKSAPRGGAQRAPLLLAAGAAAHLGYITEASFVAHVCPIDSVHFMLSITAILAALGYLGARAILGRTGAKGKNLDALGLLIAPLGLAFLLGTYFLGRPSGELVKGSSCPVKDAADLTLAIIEAGNTVRWLDSWPTLDDSRRNEARESFARGEFCTDSDLIG